MNEHPENTPGTLVVFDYNWSGHIPSYHRLITESALRSGWRTISLSGHGDEIRNHVRTCFPDGEARLVTPECSRLGRPPARKRVDRWLRWIPGSYGLWTRVRTNSRLRARHAMDRWNACRHEVARSRHLARSRVLIYLPYLDDMLESAMAATAVQIGSPWAGLHVSMSNLRDPVQRQNMAARLHLLQHAECRGVNVLDDAAAESLREYVPGLRVATVPDIADTTIAAPSPHLRASLEHRIGCRKVVGLFGHLSEPKNLSVFLDIAFAPSNRDLFFLLAGQFEPLSLPPALRNRLLVAATGGRENVWAIADRIASEAEFNWLLSRADVLFAVYRDFPRSSNILTKAGLFRRPVVVAPGFCMGERTRTYGLGLTAGQDDREGCTNAIRELLDRGPPGARYAEFAHDFSLEAFRTRLADFWDLCLNGNSR